MISIRNAKYAKIGLQDMIDYINETRDTKTMTMVEIGCYVGDSTEIFARNFKDVFCIDPWKNGYDDNDAASHQHDMKIIEKQFDEMSLKFNNIFKFKCKSSEGINHFEDGCLDLVYIDGLHTYGGVKNDIKMWFPKIKKGGFIAGHDYGSRHHPGVKEAVDEYALPDKTFRDTSWIKSI